MANASAIVGGLGNTISNTGTYAFIGGGMSNSISADGATVSGGENNIANGLNATVGGGNNDKATNGDATVSGGLNNTAGGSQATVSGGDGNTANGGQATVSGGLNNNASGIQATISGGAGNSASGSLATVSGGNNNTASGPQAAVGGGFNNTASGGQAVTCGGQNNIAQGTLSFAAGNEALALNTGAFVWGDDSTAVSIASTNNNSVTFRAAGGFQFYTSSSGRLGAGLYVAPGGNSWVTVSDRNAKKDFAPINYEDVLEKLSRVPVEQWHYQWESSSDTPNIGPMAQDFIAAFYPGRDDKGISTLEFDGVELAAIQGLNEKMEVGTQKSEARTRFLEEELQQKETEITQLKQRLEALEKIILNQKSN